MQHGTGREYVADAIANVEAALRQEMKAGRPYGDLAYVLKAAFEALLDDDFDLDTPGRYGPDHCSDAGLDEDDRLDGETLAVSGVSERTVGLIFGVEDADDGWDDYAGWVARGRPEGGYEA